MQSRYTERNRLAAEPATGRALRRPRVGFVGVGWIGRHRLECVSRAGEVEIAALVDPVPEMVERALCVAPDARPCGSMQELLTQDLDAVVIATPSALHAEQSIAALEHGLAVFCQKPLGRTATETRNVIEVARRNDRLLGVDLCYRHVAAVRRMREVVAAGELGDIYAAEVVFHNAYGPDKDWFYDPRRSGGGCVIDLGIHLIDLALWMLDFPPVEQVAARCHSGGKLLPRGGAGPAVEDYATAQLGLGSGATVRVGCSWRLPAGRDAVIEASFYGTQGGVSLRNVNGSFYDFVAERYRGTASERLADPPDAWGGRTAEHWARQLAAGARFDPAIEQVGLVAEVIDRIYGRA